MRADGGLAWVGGVIGVQNGPYGAIRVGVRGLFPDKVEATLGMTHDPHDST